MKVRQVVTKTITGDTATALDAAVATFVRGLKEEELVSIHFTHVSGLYTAFIVYAT